MKKLLLLLIIIGCSTIAFSQQTKTSTLKPLVLTVNNTIPKIDFSEKKTYYFKNNFTGTYDSYIFFGDKLLQDKNYMSWQEIAPNCNAAYNPLLKADAACIATSLASALLDNLNLKFKLFHNTTVSF